MYPTEEKDYTTSKRRTKTQAQWHKADIHVQESKDKIITTLPFAQKGKISYIDSAKEVKDNALLPSDDHPFDHFTVIANVDRTKIGKVT